MRKFDIFLAFLVGCLFGVMIVTAIFLFQEGIKRENNLEKSSEIEKTKDKSLSYWPDDGKDSILKDAIVIFPNMANVQVLGVTDDEFSMSCRPPGRYYVCMDCYKWVNLLTESELRNGTIMSKELGYKKPILRYRGSGSLPMLSRKDVSGLFVTGSRWVPPRAVRDADSTELDKHAGDKP